MPNKLRLRILGTQEIVEKYQMQMRRCQVPSLSSIIETLTIVAKKTVKIRHQVLEVLSNFSVFLQFVTNVLAGIWKQLFDFNWDQSPSHLNFWIFSLISKHFSNLDGNKKRVSSLKSCKFNDLLLALFCILGLGKSLALENFQLFGFVLF